MLSIFACCRITVVYDLESATKPYIANLNYLTGAFK